MDSYYYFWHILVYCNYNLDNIPLFISIAIVPIIIAIIDNTHCGIQLHHGGHPLKFIFLTPSHLMDNMSFVYITGHIVHYCSSFYLLTLQCYIVY